MSFLGQRLRLEFTGVDLKCKEQDNDVAVDVTDDSEVVTYCETVYEPKEFVVSVENTGVEAKLIHLIRKGRVRFAVLAVFEKIVPQMEALVAPVGQRAISESGKKIVIYLIKYQRRNQIGMSLSGVI